MLITGHGENLLRIKGILNVAGEDSPIAIHGVQHLFHPPIALPAWPDSDRHSRIVFITRDIARETIETSFRSFFESKAD
jgi:G3E family GTPase